MALGNRIVRLITTLLFFSVLFALASCSSTVELVENNDPNKYTLVKDVVWASPDGMDLTMDIYTPKIGNAPYPVVVMFHGGGWLINDKSIMDQAAAYLATHAGYVICNVDYRLLSDNGNSVALNQIVEDAFGAVLWVKDNIVRYQGDSTKVAVTGDSAGGHLTAMVVNMGGRLSSKGLAAEPMGFKPTYLPPGLTAETVAQQGGLEVQAAIPNYGVYDFHQATLDGFERMRNIFWLMGGSLPRGVFGGEFDVANNPELYKLVSPAYNIPDASQRKLPPQLLTAGSEDTLVTPASVKAYVKKLELAGQAAQYWEYEGRPHAYLDSGSNWVLGTNFASDAPPALDVMIRFLNDVFYQ